MKILIGIWLLAAAIIALPMNSHAAPILLGQFGFAGGTGKGPSLPGLPADQIGFVSFNLIFNFESSPEICIGCNRLVPLSLANGSSAVIFDASNSPDFNAAVTSVTNDVNETLLDRLILYNTSGDNLGGGGGGKLESSFGTPTDLNGRQIEFIRLHVNSFTSQVDSSGAFTSERRDVWEFWGTGVPSPSSTVPIPSSLPLLLLGLGPLGIALWWSKRRESALA